MVLNMLTLNFLSLLQIKVLFMNLFVSIPLNKMGLPELYSLKCLFQRPTREKLLLTRVLQGISSVEHILSSFPPSLLLLSLLCRVFGYVAFVYSHSPNRGKLDSRVIKCIFIGYLPNKNRYKCYHPQSRQFFVSMDGESIPEVEPVLGSLSLLSLQDIQDTNHENKHEDYNEVKGKDYKEAKAEDYKEAEEEDHNETEKEDQFFGIKYQRRKKPTLVPHDHVPSISYISYLNLFVLIISLQHRSFIAAIDAIKIPTSIQEAIKDNN
ncbi:hypothetical protein CR513_15705, partial [Mucuna pruriens]